MFGTFACLLKATQAINMQFIQSETVRLLWSFVSIGSSNNATAVSAPTKTVVVLDEEQLSRLAILIVTLFVILLLSLFVCVLIIWAIIRSAPLVAGAGSFLVKSLFGLVHSFAVLVGKVGQIAFTLSLLALGLYLWKAESFLRELDLAQFQFLYPFAFRFPRL